MKKEAFIEKVAQHSGEPSDIIDGMTGTTWQGLHVYVGMDGIYYTTVDSSVDVVFLPSTFHSEDSITL